MEFWLELMINNTRCKSVKRKCSKTGNNSVFKKERTLFEAEDERLLANL